MILEKTIQILNSRYAKHMEGLHIAQARIGIYLTALQLSDGSTGVASTLRPGNTEIHCKKENRDFGDFSPNKITGKKVTRLLEAPRKNALTDTLKVAALNALSSKIIENSTYPVLRNTDPLDLIDLNTPKTITIVGAFQSYIRRIAKTNNRLFVLEFNPGALEKNDHQFFVPATDFEKVLPVSDTVIITGLTLVNGTIDNLLQSVKPGTQVIVTGPSGSIIPDVLFENHVQIIGAVKTTDPELLLKVVSEGGTGYHLFHYCAEKICIVHE